MKIALGTKGVFHRRDSRESRRGREGKYFLYAVGYGEATGTGAKGIVKRTVKKAIRLSDE